MKTYKEYNLELLKSLSYYLNEEAKIITTNQVMKLCKIGIIEEEAFSLLLKNYLDIKNEEIFKSYFPFMIKKLKENDYTNNEYYKNIKFLNKKNKNWEFKIDCYKPYEGFVYNDFIYFDDGRVIPQIGFFSKPFYYPAVYENDRLWMSITPNEIETMKEAIDNAKGTVATFGLGLGYFTYMVSLKKEVSKIIVIEKSKDVIKLFNDYILPQFTEANKIMIINIDVFTFLNSMIKDYNIDYIFADIWHDVSDGVSLYKEIKKYEEIYPNIKFDYWIEKTMKYYL